MGLLKKISKYIHADYIKRALAAFTVTQIVLLIFIGNTWILNSSDHKNAALTWGLWRLIDLIPIFLTGGVWLLVDNIVSSSKPAIAIFGLVGVVAILDTASLIWFGFLYRDCETHNQCLANTGDPAVCGNVNDLCDIPHFKKVALYYLVPTVLLNVVNFMYAGVIGGALLLLSMEKWGVRSSSYGDRMKNNAVTDDSPLKKLKIGQYACNFLTVAWALVVLQICVLTSNSSIKYFFFAHLPHGWCFVQVMVAYDNKLQDKIAFAVAAGCLAISSLVGLLPASLYYMWNCDPAFNSHEDFANTSGCEVTIVGGRYIIALHLFMMLVACVRIFLYARTVPLLVNRSTKTQDESQNEYQVQLPSTALLKTSRNRFYAVERKASGETAIPILDDQGNVMRI